MVLNKIDALADPLASVHEVKAQIAGQRRDTARTLGIAEQRVFPLSARQALAARVEKDAVALAASRLPELEAALGAQLLPQRRQVLEQVVADGVQQIENHVIRHLGDARRQLAEQTLELRGLRGKSGGKVRLMLNRVDAETAEFEESTTLLLAMRAVHGRMLKDLLAELSADRLRDEVAAMQKEMTGSILRLGARKSFVALCGRLHGLLAGAQRRQGEIRDMLGASFMRLNGEFGFSLSVGKASDFDRFSSELQLIESNYTQYLGLGQALKLAQPAFMEQFRRMLVSKLRVVFENASSELELCNKAISAQVDSQLRDRRKAFKRRRDTLEKIQLAAGELETRIGELEAQDQRLAQFQARSSELAEQLREHAFAAPLAADAAHTEPGMPEAEAVASLDEPPAALRRQA